MIYRDTSQYIAICNNTSERGRLRLRVYSLHGYHGLGVYHIKKQYLFVVPEWSLACNIFWIFGFSIWISWRTQGHSARVHCHPCIKGSTVLTIVLSSWFPLCDTKTIWKKSGKDFCFFSKHLRSLVLYWVPPRWTSFIFLFSTGYPPPRWISKALLDRNQFSDLLAAEEGHSPKLQSHYQRHRVLEWVEIGLPYLSNSKCEVAWQRGVRCAQKHHFLNLHPHLSSSHRQNRFFMNAKSRSQIF